ncbi:hypothetical protein [Nostoc sp.]|uniref:hypothetical protein n=1 Tax=Nostoc sp. TaxID=1180 RepID=UPI002FFA051A
MGLFHSLKGAHLQASWAKNQVIKKSDWDDYHRNAFSSRGFANGNPCGIHT